MFSIVDTATGRLKPLPSLVYKGKLKGLGPMRTWLNSPQSRFRLGKDDSGFTLIELLVVIIILGILASITIVSVSTARGNAVAKACQTDAVNLRQALDQYFIDNAGTFPNVTTGNTYYVNANLTTLVSGTKTYIRSLPPLRGDASGSNYYLQINVSLTSGSTTSVSTVNTIQGYSTTAGSTGTSNTITDCLVP